MLQFNDFFNPMTLNIFTDASMNSHNTIACAGCLCVFGEVDKKLPMLQTDFQSRIYKKVTNNVGEVLAVQMGLFAAIANRQFPIIRIVSDSQITIFGIRDRILNWRESKRHPGKLIGSNDVIKNQEYFLELLYNILEEDIPIQFIHQAGHVSFSEKGLAQAAHVFAASNGLREEIDMSLIRAISAYNNYVDRETRARLYEDDLSKYNYVDPIQFHYADFDKQRYYQLTHQPIKGGIPV